MELRTPRSPDPTAVDLAQVDFCDPHTFDDAWDTYAALRALDHLHRDERNDLYVTARHEDVFHVSRDPQRYCSKFGVRPLIAGDMSIIIIRTLDGPGNPAPDGAPRRQFKIDFEIAGVLFSIVGAGLMGVKHFDGKFDKVDQKFEKFDQKFDSINQKFDQKLDSIQASVSYLSARSERQYGFEEGARSVRVKEPPSSGD